MKPATRMSMRMSVSAKTLLMVAYYYPPRGGGGVQRTVKFAKYLPSFGVRPIVLTSGTTPSGLADQTFDQAKDVVRVPYREPGRLLGRLYEYLRFERVSGWLRPAVRAALKTIHEQGVDAIYSTASPYVDHLVAMHVARELGLPWIADFRDLWTGNALYKARSPWIARKHRQAEQQIYREATHIIVTSPSQKQQIVDDFKVAPDKITIITNGFDAADFAKTKNSTQKSPATPGRTEPVHIGYIGSFYGGYRPDDLVLALRFLKQRRPEFLRSVRFTFYGDYDQASRAVLTQPDLQDVVGVFGYVPHGELDRIRAGMDATFLSLPAKGDRIKAMIPQKVFEYLAMGKPIFAVVPPSDVRDLLTRHKAAHFAPADDPLGIAHELIEFVGQVKAGTARKPLGTFTEYERKTLTGQLAQVLEKLT